VLAISDAVFVDFRMGRNPFLQKTDKLALGIIDMRTVTRACIEAMALCWWFYYIVVFCSEVRCVFRSRLFDFRFDGEINAVDLKTYPSFYACMD